MVVQLLLAQSKPLSTTAEREVKPLGVQEPLASSTPLGCSRLVLAPTLLVLVRRLAMVQRAMVNAAG